MVRIAGVLAQCGTQVQLANDYLPTQQKMPVLQDEGSLMST